MKPFGIFFFDIGNVLLFFDYGRKCKELARLVDTTEQAIQDALLGSNLEIEYEAGNYTDAEFIDLFSKNLKRKLTKEMLIQATDKMFWGNEEMRPIINSLKVDGHRLCFLSNTNSIHFDFLIGRFSILEPFKEKILSYEVGTVKPNRLIFERAIELAGCPPERCFYADDLKANIEVASKMGMHGYLFESASALKQELLRLGVSGISD